jgi:glycosyltransferase involved in cell wall biosynthesis
MIKKKILIDTRNLSLLDGTGIATYARNLAYIIKDLNYEVGLLLDRKKNFQKNEKLNEINFYDDKSYDTFFKYFKNLKSFLPYFNNKYFNLNKDKVINTDYFRNFYPFYNFLANSNNIIEISRIKFSLYRQLTNLIPNNKINDCIDIYHSTSPLPLLLKGKINICTIHDIIPLEYPYFSDDNKKNYYQLIKKILKNYNHIISVSDVTKKSLINFFDIEEKKITTTYQSVHIPENIKSLDIKSENFSLFLDNFSLKAKNYFIVYGTIERRKNILKIISSFLSIPNKNFKLVIIGKLGHYADKELETLSDLKNNKLNKRILFFNYLKRDILLNLIKGSKAIINTSFAEGFGLQLLEGMNLGVPVIASNIRAHQEIGGDASLYVDPASEEQITKAMIDIIDNEQLVNQLVDKGYKQSKLFTKEIVQSKVASVYSQFI